MTDLKDLDWAFARSQDIEGLLHQHLLGYAGSAPEFSGHIQLPGEIEFSKESGSESFGFSMGIGLEKVFGKEIANGISNALGKVKIGTLPIGPGFGSLALSEADGHSMKSFNTNIVVSGNLTMQVKGEASIKGANIDAGHLLASFDSLVLESVRSIVQNEAWGASLGISGSTGDKSTPMGKLNHIGANHRSEDGAIVDQITRLIGRETATVVVARAMHLNAAMIANAEIDDDGHYTDKGRLALKVGQLFIQNMQSYDRGEIYGLGIDLLHNNLSTENSDDKPNDNKSAHLANKKPAVGSQKKPKTPFNLHIEVGHKNRKGRVLATIGLGGVECTQADDACQLDSTNRDLNAANPMTNLKQMESIKAFIPSDLPSLSELSQDFKDASTTLMRDLEAIGNTMSDWFRTKQEEKIEEKICVDSTKLKSTQSNNFAYKNNSETQKSKIAPEKDVETSGQKGAKYTEQTVHDKYYLGKKDGRWKKSVTGHFYTKITKIDESGTEESDFFSKGSKGGLPFTLDSEIHDKSTMLARYNRNKKEDPNFVESSPMWLSEEQYNNIKHVIDNPQEERERPYWVAGDNCAAGAQRAHEAAGQIGDIGDVFTKADIHKMDSAAGRHLQSRYGLKDEDIVVSRPTFHTIEQIAKEYNVPVKRVAYIPYLSAENYYAFKIKSEKND